MGGGDGRGGKWEEGEVYCMVILQLMVSVGGDGGRWQSKSL